MAGSSSSVAVKFYFQRGSMGYTLFLSVMMAALLLATGGVPVSAQPSAVDQGATLRKLATSWGVNFTDWMANSDPCLGNWSYVTCDNATKSQVMKLTMPSAGLRGPIPPAIGDLPYLQVLNLTNNTLSDPIPAEIGKLVYLQVLVLTNNNFTEPPPQDLLKCNLTRLQMNKNQITGLLPPWIGQMTNLRYLDFNSNEMWGGYPPEYGNLANLYSMQLWENALTGYVPQL